MGGHDERRSSWVTLFRSTSWEPVQLRLHVNNVRSPASLTNIESPSSLCATAERIDLSSDATDPVNLSNGTATEACVCPNNMILCPGNNVHH